MLLIELLPLILKVLSLRSVLSPLVHADRAKIEAAARAPLRDAQMTTAMGEIENDAELANYQRLAMEDPLLLESTREKVRAAVTRQIIGAKLDAHRAERSARIEDFTAESDTVLELIHRFRRQQTEIADAFSENTQLANALSAAQRDDLRHLQESRKAYAREPA